MPITKRRHAGNILLSALALPALALSGAVLGASTARAADAWTSTPYCR